MRRSETRQRIRLAADAEGRLLGLAHEDRVSNLPEESFSEPTAQATPLPLRRRASRRYVHEVARVDLTCAGSVRAPGEAVGMLALEMRHGRAGPQRSASTRSSFACRNIPERHPESGIPYSARSFVQCLREGAERFGWSERRAEPASRREGEWWIGMGVAAAARTNILVRIARARDAGTGRHRPGRDRHDRHRHRHLRHPAPDRGRDARAVGRARRGVLGRHRPARRAGIGRLLGRVVLGLLGVPRPCQGIRRDAWPSAWAARPKT